MTKAQRELIAQHKEQLARAKQLKQEAILKNDSFGIKLMEKVIANVEENLKYLEFEASFN